MSHFEDGEPEFRLSARAWDSLIQSAAEVRDLLGEDKAILREGEVNSTTAAVALMPRRFAPRYDREFVERLAAAATGLLEKIRSARRQGCAYPYETFLNSVAEEMLMARIIDRAKQNSSEPSVLKSWKNWTTPALRTGTSNGCTTFAMMASQTTPELSSS